MLPFLAPLYSLFFNVGMAADSRFSLGAYFKTLGDQDNPDITAANLIQGSVSQVKSGGSEIQNKKAGVTQGIEAKCSTMCHDKSKLAKFENLMGKNLVTHKWYTVYGSVFYSCSSNLTNCCKLVSNNNLLQVVPLHRGGGMT